MRPTGQAAAPNSIAENLYGPTELTISCVCTDGIPMLPARCVNDVVPIGFLHPGLRYRIEPSGELCVTGDQMFPGYLDPADDEGRFLDVDGERWYRTETWFVRSTAVSWHTSGGSTTGEDPGDPGELAEIDGRCAESPALPTRSRSSSTVNTAYCPVSGSPGSHREAVDDHAASPAATTSPEFLDDFPVNANRKIDRR